LQEVAEVRDGVVGLAIPVGLLALIGIEHHGRQAGFPRSVDVAVHVIADVQRVLGRCPHAVERGLEEPPVGFAVPVVAGHDDRVEVAQQADFMQLAAGVCALRVGDDRERAALRWAEAIAWDPELADDDLWSELHQHFSEPELVELGYFIGLTMGQQRFLKTLQIRHGDLGTAVVEGDLLRYYRTSAAGEPVGDYGTADVVGAVPSTLGDTSVTTASVPNMTAATSHTAQYVDFLEAVRDSRPPLMTAAAAARTLAVVNAIYQSAAKGHPVIVTSGHP